jgi:hypothetical protein
VDNGRYRLLARRITNPAQPGPAKRVASVRGPGQIGHPSLFRHRLLYVRSGRRRNAIRSVSLGNGRRRTILASQRALLSNPSVLGKHLLYARVWRGGESPQATHPRPFNQRLLVKSLGRSGSGHRVYSAGERRRLWTTSLARRRAYVTVLGAGGAKILSVHR